MIKPNVRYLLKASQEAFSFEKNGIQTKKSSNVSDYIQK